MDKIGWHTSIKSLLETNEYKSNTYQVFVGSPRTLKEPDISNLYQLKQKKPDLDIVVHAPYVVSLCKNPANKITSATMNYLIYLARGLDRCNVKYIVTHIGGVTNGDTVKNGAIYIYDFCQKWLQATNGSNVVLCLENDAGSKSGTKMGYVKILAAIVKKINNPRVRMCLDVQHSFAGGFDILSEENLTILDNYVDVVHYNAIPSYVEFGGHLDRHSTTSLDESKVDEFIVYKKLFNGIRPFIFEVDGEPYISRNISWLQNKLDGTL